MADELTLYERQALRTMVDEPHRPASTFSDNELQRVLQSGLLRGGLVLLEENLRDKDRQIVRMCEFNNRLAAQIEELIEVANRRLERIYALEDAARDVLPTLEHHWRGPRPIPAWHPTAVLRTVLEGNQ